MTQQDSGFVVNPVPRLPVCLCLDTSYSMRGQPIADLNRGLEIFFEQVLNDDKAAQTVELAIVTFGGQARLVADFAPIGSQTIPELTVEGGTPMGAAVKLALDQLALRKERYSNASLEYYQPWLVLMTDGEATDPTEASARRASQLVRDRKLTLMPIGIGPGAVLDGLRPFSPDFPPLPLDETKFAELFAWISKSVAQVSRSNPGEDVELSVDEMRKFLRIRA